MLHILWYIIVGFVAGLIAKSIMHVHAGFLMTTLLGIVGSVVGGFIGPCFQSRQKERRFIRPALLCRSSAL
jgi:uncharacterized membrane protein YeaQ/YmgE (transglycosylase-associated protein family)